MTHETQSPALSGGPAPVPPPAPPYGEYAPRRLHRSRRDRVFAGVCGGLAEYFGVDAVLLRIVAVALALSGGAGFLPYVIAWIAIPEDGLGGAEPEPGARPVEYDDPGVAASRARSRAVAVIVGGAALVAAGVLMLLNRLLPWVDGALMWPLIVVGAGVAILASGRRRS
jgi:phage shock protein C